MLDLMMRSGVTVFLVYLVIPIALGDDVSYQACVDKYSRKGYQPWQEWSDHYTCHRYRCEIRDGKYFIAAVGCRKPKIPENALECHEYIEDENVEFPTCCARLRCVVEINGERVVQTRGQPGELFPDKPWKGQQNEPNPAVMGMGPMQQNTVVPEPQGQPAPAMYNSRGAGAYSAKTCRFQPPPWTSRAALGRWTVSVVMLDHSQETAGTCCRTQPHPPAAPTMRPRRLSPSAPAPAPPPAHPRRHGPEEAAGECTEFPPQRAAPSRVHGNFISTQYPAPPALRGQHSLCPTRELHKDDTQFVNSLRRYPLDRSPPQSPPLPPPHSPLPTPSPPPPPSRSPSPLERNASEQELYSHCYALTKTIRTGPKGRDQRTPAVVCSRPAARRPGSPRAVRYDVRYLTDVTRCINEKFKRIFAVEYDDEPTTTCPVLQQRLSQHQSQHGCESPGGRPMELCCGCRKEFNVLFDLWVNEIPISVNECPGEKDLRRALLADLKQHLYCKKSKFGEEIFLDAIRQEVNELVHQLPMWRPSHQVKEFENKIADSLIIKMQALRIRETVKGKIKQLVMQLPFKPRPVSLSIRIKNITDDILKKISNIFGSNYLPDPNALREFVTQEIYEVLDNVLIERHTPKRQEEIQNIVNEITETILDTARKKPDTNKEPRTSAKIKRNLSAVIENWVNDIDEINRLTQIEKKKNIQPLRETVNNFFVKRITEKTESELYDDITDWLEMLSDKVGQRMSPVKLKRLTDDLIRNVKQCIAQSSPGRHSKNINEKEKLTERFKPDVMEMVDHAEIKLEENKEVVHNLADFLADNALRNNDDEYTHSEITNYLKSLGVTPSTSNTIADELLDLVHQISSIPETFSSFDPMSSFDQNRRISTEKEIKLFLKELNVKQNPNHELMVQKFASKIDDIILRTNLTPEGKHDQIVKVINDFLRRLSIDEEARYVEQSNDLAFRIRAGLNASTPKRKVNINQRSVYSSKSDTPNKSNFQNTKQFIIHNLEGCIKDWMQERLPNLAINGADRQQQNKIISKLSNKINSVIENATTFNDDVDKYILQEITAILNEYISKSGVENMQLKPMFEELFNRIKNLQILQDISDLNTESPINETVNLTNTALSNRKNQTAIELAKRVIKNLNEVLKSNDDIDTNVIKELTQCLKDNMYTDQDQKINQSLEGTGNNTNGNINILEILEDLLHINENRPKQNWKPGTSNSLSEYRLMNSLDIENKNKVTSAVLEALKEFVKNKQNLSNRFDSAKVQEINRTARDRIISPRKIRNMKPLENDLLETPENNIVLDDLQNDYRTNSTLQENINHNDGLEEMNHHTDKSGQNPKKMVGRPQISAEIQHAENEISELADVINRIVKEVPDLDESAEHKLLNDIVKTVKKFCADFSKNHDSNVNLLPTDLENVKSNDLLGDMKSSNWSPRSINVQSRGKSRPETENLAHRSDESHNKEKYELPRSSLAGDKLMKLITEWLEDRSTDQQTSPVKKAQQKRQIYDLIERIKTTAKKPLELDEYAENKLFDQIANTLNNMQNDPKNKRNSYINLLATDLLNQIKNNTVFGETTSRGNEYQEQETPQPAEEHLTTARFTEQSRFPRSSIVGDKVNNLIEDWFKEQSIDQLTNTVNKAQKKQEISHLQDAIKEILRKSQNFDQETESKLFDIIGNTLKKIQSDPKKTRISYISPLASELLKLIKNNIFVEDTTSSRNEPIDQVIREKLIKEKGRADPSYGKENSRFPTSSLVDDKLNNFIEDWVKEHLMDQPINKVKKAQQKRRIDDLTDDIKETLNISPALDEEAERKLLDKIANTLKYMHSDPKQTRNSYISPLATELLDHLKNNLLLDGTILRGNESHDQVSSQLTKENVTPRADRLRDNDILRLPRSSIADDKLNNFIEDWLKDQPVSIAEKAQQKQQFSDLMGEIKNIVKESPEIDEDAENKMIYKLANTLKNMQSDPNKMRNSYINPLASELLNQMKNNLLLEESKSRGNKRDQYSPDIIEENVTPRTSRDKENLRLLKSPISEEKLSNFVEEWLKDKLIEHPTSIAQKAQQKQQISDLNDEIKEILNNSTQLDEDAENQLLDKIVNTLKSIRNDPKSQDRDYMDTLANDLLKQIKNKVLLESVSQSPRTKKLLDNGNFRPTVKTLPDQQNNNKKDKILTIYPKSLEEKLNTIIKYWFQHQIPDLPTDSTDSLKQHISDLTNTIKWYVKKAPMVNNDLEKSLLNEVHKSLKQLSGLVKKNDSFIKPLARELIDHLKESKILHQLSRESNTQTEDNYKKALKGIIQSWVENEGLILKDETFVNSLANDMNDWHKYYQANLGEDSGSDRLVPDAKFIVYKRIDKDIDKEDAEKIVDKVSSLINRIEKVKVPNYVEQKYDTTQREKTKENFKETVEKIVLDWFDMFTIPVKDNTVAKDIANDVNDWQKYNQEHPGLVYPSRFLPDLQFFVFKRLNNELANDDDVRRAVEKVVTLKQLLENVPVPDYSQQTYKDQAIDAGLQHRITQTSMNNEGIPKKSSSTCPCDPSVFQPPPCQPPPCKSTRYQSPSREMLFCPRASQLPQISLCPSFLKTESGACPTLMGTSAIRCESMADCSQSQKFCGLTPHASHGLCDVSPCESSARHHYYQPPGCVRVPLKHARSRKEKWGPCASGTSRPCPSGKWQRRVTCTSEFICPRCHSSAKKRGSEHKGSCSHPKRFCQ